MRKIAVFTGTRAEYGLLYWVIKGIHESTEVELQLYVGGMHLSPEFGYTINQIEKDGFPVTERMEFLLSSDSPVGISKSMGLALISSAEVLDRNKPDLIVLLGDRFESMAVAQAAMVGCIPIAHIHGGETTEGLIDEAVRHSITKMGHLHFTATEDYQKRIKQLGEQPERIFNFGAPGIDSIVNLELLKLHEEYVDKDRGIVFSQRVQPDIFNDLERAGTVFVPMDEFGEYHHNFDKQYFLDWADEFSQMNDFEIQKSEGVSGLIGKVDWDFIGGNDDRFAPAYWEDADLFIRMINESYKFVLTSKSVVYHFASRASRFPDDDLTIRPTNLADIEKRSTQRFAEKYGRLPERDEHDFYIPLQIIDGSPNRINQ